MADSGKPVAGEVIHKTDMDNFVTGIISEGKDFDDNYVTRYYYQTASGSKYSFATSAGASTPMGYNDSFVTVEALVASLDNKADKNNSSQTITAKTFTGTLSGNATTATALGDDFGFHQRANTESSSTKVTFKVTPNKAYLLFQTHSNHYGVYLISTYAKGYATILDNNDGLTGLSVNNDGNKITVTSSAGRLSLIMVGRNT